MKYLVISVLILFLSAASAEKPNFLIIMADDLGYSDLGCYGSEIKTPVLDGLAANGLKYSQFYNTARCWPTRSALMSGYYPQQIGRDKVLDIKGGGSFKRPKWAPLMTKYLKEAGYRNYHSGKWHIDGDVLAGGFHQSYHLKDQHRFFNPTLHFEDDKKLPPVKRESGFYGTVAVTDKMLGYLKDHQTSHSGRPFFAYLAYAAPHFPLHALPEDIKAVGDRYKDGWDVTRMKRWERLQKLGLVKGKLSAVERNVGPPYAFKDPYKKLGPNEVVRPLPWDELTEGQKNFQQDKMTIHAAMIERMDKEIGRVIEQIETMDALKNTLVIFLSDNGASAEIMVRGDGHDPKAPRGSAASHLCLGPGWSTVCNTPFRRHKTWVHEGGSSTPFIVHWPEIIKAKGELRSQTAHVIDLAPTILELAGVKKTVEAPVPLPGRSLIKTFENSESWERTLWWAHDGHHAIRFGDWKLVSVKGGNWELYDLAKDRTETANVAERYPERVQDLSKIWRKMVSEFKKNTPTGKSRKKK